MENRNLQRMRRKYQNGSAYVLYRQAFSKIQAGGKRLRAVPDKSAGPGKRRNAYENAKHQGHEQERF